MTHPFSFLLVLLLVCSSLSGQVIVDPGRPTTPLLPFELSNLDNLIPPSPDASQAVKYADFPVLYSLGVPDISIPVYTVKSGTLRVPLRFSYHASGIKVDEMAGVLGLGWSLDAGGTIAKTVIGMPDEGVYGYPRTAIPFEYRTASTIRSNPSSSNFEYLFNVLENRRDSKCDRYSYNFGGYSGTFFILPGPGGVSEFVDLSGSDLHFSRIGTGFTVSTPDGTRYEFTPQEGVSRKQPSSIWAANDSPNPLPADYETTSSWRVSRIVAANGVDAIGFTYGSGGSCTRRTPLLSTTSGQSDGGSNNGQWRQSGGLDSYSDTEYTCTVLTGISFPGGTVTFSYSARPSGSTPDLLASYPRILTEVVVKNPSGQQIRKYSISHSTPSSSRRGMSSVLVYGRTSALVDRYDFSYYGPSTVNRDAQDYFGYHNGRSSNTDMLFLERTNTVTPVIDSTKRQYHFQSALAGSLREIRRLRGERTEITYGKNSCPVRNGRTVNIGLRVESIGVFNGQELVRRRNFEYHDPVLTMNFIPQENAASYTTVSSEHALVPVSGMAYQLTHTDKVTFHASTVLPGTAPEEQKVFYRHVTERVVSGDGMETCSVDYFYDSAPAMYPTGSTHQYFPSEPPSGLLQPRRYVRNDQHMHRTYFYEFHPVYSHLIRKVTQYAHETSPSSGLLKRVEETVYSKFRERNVGVGLYLRDILNYPSSVSADYLAGQRRHTACSDFLYADLMARVVSWQPSTTMTTSYYHDGSSKVEQVSYNYTEHYRYSSWPNGSVTSGGTSSTLLPKTTTRTIDGVTYLHRHLYTSSYPSLYSPVDGVTLHLPAGEEVYRNNLLLYGQYTRYEAAGGGLRPTTTTVLNTSATLSRYQVHEYNAKGRPIHISEEDDVHTCLIWDASGEHLLAEIRNATASEVRALLGTTFSGDPSGLRTTLKKAHVTTLTHLPLIGISSITDPSGRKIMYDYDDACRLKSMQDESGNILETYEYKNL